MQSRFFKSMGKVIQFMRGRYGFDDFSKFLMYSSVGFMALAFLTQVSVLSTIGFAFMVYAYMRALSRNQVGRYKELRFYREIIQKVQLRLTKIKSMLTKGKNGWKQRKFYKYYSCPDCQQRIRVPKGKNKIKITCPRCQKKFIKKT